MLEPLHPDNEPIPTVLELYERKDGSAEATAFDKKMRPTAFRLLPKGQDVISEIMRRNAAATKARGSLRWEESESMRRVHERKKAKRADARKVRG